LKKEEADARKKATSVIESEAAKAQQILNKEMQQAEQAFQQGATSYEKFARTVGAAISSPFRTAGNLVRDYLLAVGPVGAIVTGVAIGVAKLASSLTELVKAESEAAINTRNLALQLNITWKEARELEQSSKIAGINVNSLHSASSKLADA